MSAGCPQWCDRAHVTVDDGVIRHSVTEWAPGLATDVEVRLLREGDDGPVVLSVGAEAFLHLDQVETLLHTITRVANRERHSRYTVDVARRVSEAIGGSDPMLRLDVVAEATGINRAVLNRRLLGVSPFTIVELAAIACHLGISPTDLLPGRQP